MTKTPNTDALLPEQDEKPYCLGCGTYSDAFKCKCYDEPKRDKYSLQLERFEGYCDESGISLSAFLDGSYTDSDSEELWMMWKAASIGRDVTRTPKPSVTSEMLRDVITKWGIKRAHFQKREDAADDLAQAILTAFHVSKKEG